MTLNLDTFLLIAALICFLLHAFGVNTGRVNTVGLGLALVVLAMLV